MTGKNIGTLTRSLAALGVLAILPGCSSFSGNKEYSTFSYEPISGGSIGINLKIDEEAIPEIERGIVLYSATLGIPANGVSTQSFATDYGLYMDTDSDFIIDKDEVADFFVEARKYKEQHMKPLPRLNSSSQSYVGPRE